MGTQPVPILSIDDDGFSREQRDEFNLIQEQAIRYTTKPIPFVCPNCIGSAIGEKTGDNVHYYKVYRCNPCNAQKARYQRCLKYAEKLYEFAQNRNMYVWAITITLGNDVHKCVEHTTVDELRQLMMYRMNRMRDRSPEWSVWFPAGYQVFEHTEKDGVYHPHLHIVAVSPLAKLPLMDQKKVTVHSVLKKFKFGEYVYATRAYTYVNGKKEIARSLKSTISAVRYAMKYAVKDTGGSRKLSAFGAMRNYNPEIKDEPLLYVLPDNFTNNRLAHGIIGLPAREVNNYWADIQPTEEASLEAFL